MTEICYPYLPADRVFRFVGDDDACMVAAAQAREACAGDRLFPVGAVLVRDGQVLARAGNGYNRGKEFVHVCPRVVLECPSGTGYDLCTHHDSSGHAEPQLMAAARSAQIDPFGCDVYLYGHWWCCEPCWSAMIKAGIRDVYLLKNAHHVFERDRVYAQTLRPRVKRAYIAGAYTNNSGLQDDLVVYDGLAQVCSALGCQSVIPFRDYAAPVGNHEDGSVQSVFDWAHDQIKTCDVMIANVSLPSLGAGGELVIAHILHKPIVLISKQEASVSNFALENPSVVYHIQYQTSEQLFRQIKLVLQQIS